MKKYYAWRTSDGAMFVSVALYTAEELAETSGGAELLFEIEAATGEEAAAICNLRMGFGAYEPEGEPEKCPGCEFWYYPMGSGECWKCGKIGNHDKDH